MIADLGGFEEHLTKPRWQDVDGGVRHLAETYDVPARIPAKTIPDVGDLSVSANKNTHIGLTSVFRCRSGKETEVTVYLCLLSEIRPKYASLVQYQSIASLGLV